jgi:hypothetical protein
VQALLPRLVGPVSRAFLSWKRSILTEIHLCHACSYQEIEYENAREGRLSVPRNLRSTTQHDLCPVSTEK